MGIVVSGEDRKFSSSDEQQAIDEIAAENDFGLVITTLDQLFVFFGTWWSSSLTGRIHTFRHYTHAALLDMIRSERETTGVLGFYFAGIPAWTISSGLAIARDNPMKRVFAVARDYVLDLAGADKLSFGVRSLFVLTYSVLRTSLLLVSIETHLYSLLQSLALVPSNSIPTVTSLLPFGNGSLLFLPSLPTEISGHSIFHFAMRALTSPGVLAFIHAFYLRPNLEERIYRLIRRQLPKPTLADKLSVRVAYDENLIDWIVPALGRHSEEESRREQLTLMEDLKYEALLFRDWIFSFLGFHPRSYAIRQAPGNLNQERIRQLRHSIEDLQHQLEDVQSRNAFVGGLSNSSMANRAHIAGNHNSDDGHPSSLQTIDEHEQVPGMQMGINQVFTNENRISQSPGEMSNDFFSSVTGALGGTPVHPSTSISRTPRRTAQSNDNENGIIRSQLHSRTNTLSSRPSSPETSPPASPRVRASLIHQGSDVITMQLELLSNRNHHGPNSGPMPISSVSHPGHVNAGLHPLSTTASDRRSIANFLEFLIMSQAQSQPPQASSAENHQNIVPAASTANSLAAQDVSGVEHPLRHRSEVVTTVDQAAEFDQDDDVASNAPTLPLPPEERERWVDHHSSPPAPRNQRIEPENGVFGNAPPPPRGSRGVEQVNSTNPSIAHRVTLLSAHPVDSLASHLASFIATMILSPLESLCLRSLASSYLASNPLSRDRESVYPIGLWFGGDSWPDMFAYNGRIILMRGMQAAIRAGIWGFLVGSTMRIGRKFCGWGKL
ncbi:Uncharacterized protein PECH_006697 [Penicillium ucsense]|uniref:Uncharacterized protein n=1 Tax=Penicillium ucsense TaxID=2839758 RepID=A0A8J8WL44_9EURO|nr:Uncharacterized protein PECM_004356 [Penicillium ucsense]KAF7735395.1 Uncharacterized protein PECH_006697 [Penicillium ucsense]